jgi:hypothetical protein
MLREPKPRYGRFSSGVLAICVKLHGPDHPNTAVNLNNLATLFYAHGMCADARGLYERALTILDVRLGPEHHLTQTVRGNLQNLPGS